MIRKNMIALANFIKGKKVDMSMVIQDRRRAGSGCWDIENFVIEFPYKCSTIGCIVGWGKYFVKENGGQDLSDSGVSKFLGITRQQADNLFMPENYGKPLGKYSVESRVQRVLRGKIKLTSDWLHNPVKVKS